jgi:hypothetical protein
MTQIKEIILDIFLKNFTIYFQIKLFTSFPNEKTISIPQNPQLAQARFSPAPGDNGELLRF